MTIPKWSVPALAVALIIVLWGAAALMDTGTPAVKIQDTSPPAPDQGSTAMPLPDFSFTTIQGRAMRLFDLRGKVVIVNLWASWCAPCVTEFPILIDLVHKYDGRVVLVALSSDHSRVDLDRFLARAKGQGIPWNHPNVFIAHDADRHVTRDLLGVSTYPESFIIGTDGTIKRHLIGTTAWGQIHWEEMLK